MSDLTLLSSRLTDGSAWFDESEHIYYSSSVPEEDFPEEGDKLVSGSQFAGRYKPEFKREMILNAISYKHKIPTEDIERQWELKRQASLDLGNAVHGALELRGESYRTGGPVATCGHSWLQSVTDAFYSDLTRKEEECLHEAFVISEEHKACGLVDRVVIHSWEDRTLSIGDYKTNADLYKGQGKLLKPFSHMKNNPLSAYEIQLNFYAEIVEQAGWTVEGLEVFWLRNFGGPVWDTITVPRFPVLKHL